MGKRHLPPFETGRSRLRLLEEQDLARTLAWRNQDHIRRWFFYSERLTIEQHAGWFARYQQRDDDFVFIIEEHCRHTPCAVRSSCPPPAGDGMFRPIGQAALYNVDWVGRTAEYGRLMIGEADAAGRGLAREATAAVLALAFEQLGLQEVHCDIIPGNVRSIMACEACGLEIIGSTERAVRLSKRAVVRAASGVAGS